MIQNLAVKAQDEKYFKSIRYFSHLLKGEKRREFILLLSDYNIYLAAQCIMSAEKDEQIENALIQKAETYAKDFENSEKSAKGFLALAEFENFEIISTLLIDVQRPSNTHLKVFIKILEGNNQNIFLSFIKILIEVRKTVFILYAVSAYNGELFPDSNSKSILNKLFIFLFENGNYGLARIMFEKYNLYDDLKFILDEDPQNLVVKLLNSSKKQLTATKLAYEITLQFELQNLFPPEIFIKAALSKIGKSNKMLHLAIDIAVKNNIKNIEQIDNKLSALISRQNSKTKNKVNQLVKKGLLRYLNNNETLLNKYKSILNLNIQKEKPNDTVKTLFTPELSEKVEEINSIDDAEKSDFIKNQINIFFNYNNKQIIDILIKKLVEDYHASLMQISHLFRSFEFEGQVKYILEFGCYVFPKKFKSSKLLFLHKNQITPNLINHPSEILKEGDVIKFRIIGINQVTLRLNISCLDIFEPKDEL